MLLHRAVRLLPLLTLGLAASPARAATPPHYGPPVPITPVETGLASYYADRFEGRPTANGERFAQLDCTAAHLFLPFGSVLRVTNLANGREVLVRVNDRGPFKGGRILDLSRSAAEELGMIDAGLATVRIELVRLGARG